LRDSRYWLRFAIAAPCACFIWFVFGYFASKMFPRHVEARGARPPLFSLFRLDSEVMYTLLGLVAGAQICQMFHYASEKHGAASGMRLYTDPMQHGLGWALLQVPVYLVLWDFVFYSLHRWVLHNKFIYKYIHAGHHTFRPPTAWSGIAVGPVDLLFEGILPYTLPLFCGLPFHEGTVQAINALLTLHALVLHSSCHAEYGDISPALGWLLISPKGHNMHHQYGEKNACNFATVFKVWDRAFGTLNEKDPWWWASDRKAAAERDAAKHAKKAPSLVRQASDVAASVLAVAS